MPKVISRAVVSSSETGQQTQSARAVLRSYYCLCGDFVLVLQGKLDRLPKRKTDGSYIIRSQAGAKPAKQPARKFKLNAQPGQRCLIRKKGTQDLEVRQHFVCGRCNTTVAYQTDPPPAGESPFMYILKGAMTELQGRVPHDAFEGEENLPQKEGEEEEEDLAKDLDPLPAS